MTWGWTAGALGNDELMADKRRLYDLAGRALETLAKMGREEGLRLVSKAELHALWATNRGGWEVGDAAGAEMDRRESLLR